MDPVTDGAPDVGDLRLVEVGADEVKAGGSDEVFFVVGFDFEVVQSEDVVFEFVDVLVEFDEFGGVEG